MARACGTIASDCEGRGPGLAACRWAGGGVLPRVAGIPHLAGRGPGSRVESLNHGEARSGVGREVTEPWHGEVRGRPDVVWSTCDRRRGSIFVRCVHGRVRVWIGCEATGPRRGEVRDRL